MEPDLQSFSYRLKKLEIGLVLLDNSWRITDCDAMARSLLGRPPGTLRTLFLRDPVCRLRQLVAIHCRLRSVP